MESKQTQEDRNKMIELTAVAAIGIGSALVGAGTGWGVTRKTIANLEADVASLEKNEREVIDRLARIETKLDTVIGVK